MAEIPQQKVCAYCGNTGRFTSEHIWPRGILKRTNYGVRFGIKIGKTISGDMTINDVCRECNNGPLSRLDDYACDLYDRYFACVPESGDFIEFRYDFALLMRWLLKISYNATRTTGIDAKLLSHYSSMLISDYPASPINVAAFVGTATVGWFEKPNGEKPTKIPPLGVRCGPIVIPEIDYQKWCTLRVVTINGFMFTILLMKQPVIEPRVADAVINGIYGVPLLPNGVINIPPPVKTALDFYAGVERWPRGHR